MLDLMPAAAAAVPGTAMVMPVQQGKIKMVPKVRENAQSIKVAGIAQSEDDHKVASSLLACRHPHPETH